MLRFVWLHGGSEPAAHIIHSNIGPGQAYTYDEAGHFTWLDVSPGVPVTLGSPATKGRDVAIPVGGTSLEVPFNGLAPAVDLNPPLVAGQVSQGITGVSYQVEVSFQWDAGNWWVEKTEAGPNGPGFTLHWTTPAPDGAKLDWTLHI